MTEREKIAARIRALLAKTVENGCTEDEAVAAADMAAKLLEKYNLTMDEVELRKSDFIKHTERHNDEVGRRLWKVAKGIAHLTDTKSWSSDHGVFPYVVNFFGLDHEVEIARYLLAICARAMRQEHNRLKRVYGLLNPTRQRLKINPFLDGMADSLYERIRALKPATPTGTGLVVLKDELVTKAMADEGIKLRSLRAAKSDTADTYLRGREAGNRVSLNPGVAADSPRKLLT